ncbi:hypothetical protein F4821DRAFT_219457 [Hypoxylon rubiginosum]|uniref:Uncharacterized protein n=1 Tax=Hypoxylon rubiginosum TaxID=110542 RepID=A0ACC0CP21_9PEZI|nr:hypothetical protein F4821DRAFT_219457 [Hypoxylon rubiginosum]
MSTEYAGIIEPPAGVEPNFVNPPSQQEGMIALHTVCLTLVIGLVVMRLYTRISITKSALGVDDYLCIVSNAITFAYSGLIFKAFGWGIGRHIWDVPHEWLVEGMKLSTIACYVYLVLAATTRLTFLFSYRRIFSSKRSYKYAIDGGIGFTISAAISLLLATVFTCAPIERGWDATISGHCFNYDIIGYLSGAINSLIDLYILVLPMPLCWRLNLDARRKWRLTMVFGLGFFACIASLVRLGMTDVMRSNLDMTWNVTRVCAWATIEVNVGIICSCLISLPAFLDRHLPGTVRSFAARVWTDAPRPTSTRTQQGTILLKGDPGSWFGYRHQSRSEFQHLVSPKPSQFTINTEPFGLESVSSYHLPQPQPTYSKSIV